jgi:uncharacterized protein YkwD
LFNVKQHEIVTPKANIVYEEIEIKPTPTKFNDKEISETSAIPTVIVRPTKIADTGPWGVARQIDEHTWTMKIQMDAKMGTPKEVLEALNAYRKVHGSGPVEMDERLNNYAMERAKYFTSRNGVDSHEGFAKKLENIEGFKELGFWSLGENASYGYRLEAVHLIEWMYASDEDHNQNQLEPRWTHVGIGIDGVATAIIFAKDRI